MIVLNYQGRLYYRGLKESHIPHNTFKRIIFSLLIEKLKSDTFNQHFKLPLNTTCFKDP